MSLSPQKACCLCLHKKLIVVFVSTKSLLPLSPQKTYCCLCLHKKLVAYVSTKSSLLPLSPQKACCLCLHKKLIVVFASTKYLLTLPSKMLNSLCSIRLQNRLTVSRLLSKMLRKIKIKKPNAHTPSYLLGAKSCWVHHHVPLLLLLLLLPLLLQTLRER